MKAIVLQESLINALKVCRLAVNTNSQLPILSTVLLKTQKGKMTLSTTDLYIGVRSNLVCDTEDENSIAIPIQPFYELINSLSPGKITLDLKDTTLHIISEKNKSQLQIMSAKDFPPFPEMEGEKIILKRNDFDQVINYVPFATSKDETRPALTAVLFKLGKESQVVGTDGFRLSLLKLQNVYSEKQIMVPAKALQEVYKVLISTSQEDIQFQLSDKLKQLFFIVGEYEIFIRLIDASYPPYEKIIPQNFTLSAEIDVQELQTLIKRACIFAKESSYVIQFSFTKNNLLVQAISSTLGKQEGNMNINTLEGETGEIAFNAQYLLDYLQRIKGKSIRFSMNDELQPAQFQSKIASDFIYIVMPFRLQK